MKPILEIKSLSKKYRIRHQQESYLSLREQILNAIRPDEKTTEDFWALDDVSFSVDPGSSVGIVGSNGAGKSTLLKLLSKITFPSRGKIVTRGRIASLLEVGTGFHPELTGRENIYFNGSLLGMKRREIQNKFDEIVDFSGVERFLDTPLKHFSSGMQLRLAFSVAAFLEPEILVIDEVLAVGDAEFQRKCFGKMENVSKSGRTILFVSHNMQALANLCKKGIYLKRGKLEFASDIHSTIDHYLQESSESYSLTQWEQVRRKLSTDPELKVHEIGFTQDSLPVVGDVVNGKDLVMEIRYELPKKLNRFRIFLDVCDSMGTVILRTFHDEQSVTQAMDQGNYISRLTIPADFLAPLPYEFRLFFGIHNIRMMEPKEGISFKINVQQTGAYNKAYAGMLTAGSISPVLPWQIIKV